MNQEETKRALELLATYPDCVAWTDFGNDRRWEAAQDWKKEVESAARVASVMPPESTLYAVLRQRVAATLGNRWVTFPWLVKSAGRILSLSDYGEFRHMLNLSLRIKAEMRRRGLGEIDSTDELF